MSVLSVVPIKLVAGAVPELPVRVQKFKVDEPVPPFATLSTVFQVGASPDAVVCKNCPAALEAATDVNVFAAEVYNTVFVPPKVVNPVPPFATGNIPAVVGKVVNVDQPGAPAVVFINKAPVVAPGANNETALVPAPYRRSFAVIDAKPVPPFATGNILAPTAPELARLILPKPIELPD